MALDPDETCGICGNTRDYHGDANHEFNADGVLIKKQKAEPPRQQAPLTRDEAAMSVQMQHRLIMRMLELFIDKGLLDAKDLLKILGGDNVPPNQEGTQQT